MDAEGFDGDGILSLITAYSAWFLNLHVMRRTRARKASWVCDGPKARDATILVRHLSKSRPRPVLNRSARGFRIHGDIRQRINAIRRSTRTVFNSFRWGHSSNPVIRKPIESHAESVPGACSRDLKFSGFCRLR